MPLSQPRCHRVQRFFSKSARSPAQCSEVAQAPSYQAATSPVLPSRDSADFANCRRRRTAQLGVQSHGCSNTEPPGVDRVGPCSRVSAYEGGARGTRIQPKQYLSTASSRHGISKGFRIKSDAPFTSFGSAVALNTTTAISAMVGSAFFSLINSYPSITGI